MNRLTIRIVAVVIGLCVAGYVGMSRKGDASKKTLAAAHRLVAKVDGYADKPDYYDWLVDAAHEAVFDESFHADYSKYHNNSWVDGDKYLEELFAWMINQANEDHAAAVVEALTKYRDSHVRDEAPATNRRGGR